MVADTEVSVGVLGQRGRLGEGYLGQDDALTSFVGIDGIATERPLDIRLLDDFSPVTGGSGVHAEAGCGSAVTLVGLRGGSARTAGPQAAGHRVGMGEEGEGGAFGVGGLSGDVDHRERRGRLSWAGAGELFVDVLVGDVANAAESPSGRGVDLVDDEFGVLAAIEEEFELIVRGVRAVLLDEQLVAWPAVQRVPHSKGGSGQDLG